MTVHRHGHSELWSREEQFRYEDRIAAELAELNEQIRTLVVRVSVFMGGITVLAFLLPVVAPFIRAMLGIEP